MIVQDNQMKWVFDFDCSCKIHTELILKMSKMITGFHEKKCTKTSHTSLHPIFYPINKLDRQANRQWNKNNSNLNKMLQNKEHVHLLSWQTNMTTIHQHSFTRQSCILNTIQFFTKVNISKSIWNTSPVTWFCQTPLE